MSTLIFQDKKNQSYLRESKQTYFSTIYSSYKCNMLLISTKLIEVVSPEMQILWKDIRTQLYLNCRNNSNERWFSCKDIEVKKAF